jgi:predicted transcriptional regulator
MIQSRKIKKRNLFGLLFIIVFSLLFMMFIMPLNVTAAPPQVIIVDTAPQFVNESSPPICVFSLNLTDDDGAILENITVTVVNASAGFDPNTDLAPISSGNLSGVMIYEETNAQSGFQFNDSPLGMTPMGWMGSGPWYTDFYGMGHILPITTSGPNYYIVIRTSPIISNDESFRVGIETGNIMTNQGGLPSSSNWTKTIIADTLDPLPSIIVYSENTVTKVGDWVNITANISGDDATAVTVNLTDFNGLSYNEPMIYDSGDKIWYYNITSLLEGAIDTEIFGYLFEVRAQDKAGKIAMGGNYSEQIDTILPTAVAGIIQEDNPAAIGNWINITVTTDSDTQYVSANLSAFSGQQTATVFEGSGTNWYHNFTVLEGILDGSYQINVTAIDDAGNSNYDDSESVFVDEVQPTVDVLIIQESNPAGIGDWINITVNTDLDVISVYADLASAGFSNQVDNQPLENLGGGIWYYNFTISQGLFDGFSSINIVAVDDVNQIGSNSSQTANWDEQIPMVLVSIVQESQPAGIGNWINITVNTDSDVVNVIGNLMEFSGQGGMESFIDSGTYWYYNFTIFQGVLEGDGALVISVLDDAGNLNSNDTQTAYVDEIVPGVDVDIKQESNPVGVGGWINITVTTDYDVTHVEADLAQAGFSNQVDDQPLTRINSTTWYYLFTISSGNTDASTGISLNLEIVDGAGNKEINSENVYFDEVYPEPVLITLKTEASGSAYAKIGDWINITVDMGGHTDITAMWVDSLGIFIKEPITQNYGSIWYLNTTIPEGTANGEVQFNITISDDANNIVTLSKNTQVNNIPLPPDTKTPDEGISWGLVLLITCAALVGSGGVVVGATEIGHYSFFFIFYLLYTRLKKEYILDNFTRGRIYGYVEANPGEHFNAIKRALGIKNGSLAYHLRTLEKGGYIVSKRDRGYTRFYPKSMKLPKKNVKELIPIQRSIIEIIKSNPGISQRGIAEKMNISYQLVHYHIKVLQEANYLNLKKDRKQTYCYETEEIVEIPEVA